MMKHKITTILLVVFFSGVIAVVTFVGLSMSGYKYSEVTSLFLFIALSLLGGFTFRFSPVWEKKPENPTLYAYTGKLEDQGNGSGTGKL